MHFPCLLPIQGIFVSKRSIERKDIRIVPTIGILYHPFQRRSEQLMVPIDVDTSPHLRQRTVVARSMYTGFLSPLLPSHILDRCIDDHDRISGELNVIAPPVVQYTSKSHSVRGGHILACRF